MAEARKSGKNLSVPDSQIEATAIHFGLTIVSRNQKDFFRPVVSPW
jgi:predicted nucleic acid-binding protein